VSIASQLLKIASIRSLSDRVGQLATCQYMVFLIFLKKF